MGTEPKQFTAATIYAPHYVFGYIVRIDVKWAKLWIAPYAQHEECVQGEYVRRGKRKVESLLGCDFYVVVVSAKEAIEPSNPYLPIVDSMEQLRYLVGNAGWKKDFDEKLRSSGVPILADYRRPLSDITYGNFLGSQLQEPLGHAAVISSKDHEREYEEGVRYQVERFFFQRNPKLVEEAKKVLGCACQVCGFDFANGYGVLGKGYIEMHHCSPLSENLGEEWGDEVRTSVADVAVLCANCHRMVHRRKPALSIEELKTAIKMGAQTEAYGGAYLTRS